MTRFKNYRKDLITLAGFLVLPLLIYGSVTIGSKTMVPADNLFQWAPWASSAADFQISFPQNALISDLILENYPWKEFVNSNIKDGQIPLWNPHIFAGTPFLATGQHGAYYPFSLIFIILPLSKAYGWYTVSQLWLAGILAYLFARTLGQRRSSSAITGLVYQGSGFMLVSSAVFPMILGAAVWLPLLLASIEMVIRNSTHSRKAGQTLPWAAVGSLALGLQILAGHIEITYYTLLIMAFYAVWRLASLLVKFRKQKIHLQSSNEMAKEALPPESLRLLLVKPFLWLSGLVFIGIMLGSIQFIPFIEVGQANFREGSATLAQIRGWAFPPRRITTLAMPDMYGSPADHDYFDIFGGETVTFSTNYYGELNPHGPYTSNWGIKNYVEGGIYLGILPLFLAFLGLVSAYRLRVERRSEIGFFAVLSFLSLSFIFGTPLYALLYYGLPGINQLHSPFRWVFPFSLCIAILAGYGLDFAQDEKMVSTGTTKDKNRIHRWKVLGLIGSLGAKRTVTTVLAGLAVWSGIFLLMLVLISRIFYASLRPTFESIFLGMVQATDAFAGVDAFYSFQIEQILILAIILVLTGLVLRLLYWRLTAQRKRLWILLVFGLILVDLFIAGRGFNASVDPKLLDFKPELTQWLADQPGLWRLTTFSPHGDKPLNANTPWLSDLQDIRGYDSIILRQFTDYMAAIEPQTELPFNRIQPIINWQSLNSPLLDLLGVRFIVTRETLDLPKLKLVWEGEDLRVYENLASIPRAFSIDSSATKLVEDPLAAMQDYDPRQFVLVENDSLSPSSFKPVQARSLAAADVIEYGNNEVIIRAEFPVESWLILNDTHFEGWDAYARDLDEMDGEAKVNLYRVNGNFRGVLLESGNWEVRFRYSPLSFKLGGLVSFMGAIIITFAAGVWTWRRLVDGSMPLTNTRSIAKNSLAPMTLNLFNRAIDFVFAAFYLRVLGPADAGKYATAIIIAGWFEIVSNWGLNTLIIREVSRDKNQASSYLLNSSILRLGTTVIASAPIAIYFFGVQLTGDPLDAQTSAAILLLMAGMFFSGLSQGIAGLFYAFEVAEFPAAITTVTTILKVGFGVTVLLLGFGFVGLAGISILVNVITLLILVGAALRKFQLRGPWKIDIGLQRTMLATSYPLMLNHLFAVIFFQIDVPLMKQINGDEVVGWYNSAYKWVLAFNVIPSFFTIALFPVISRQVQSSLDDARRTFRMAIKFMLLIAFPLAIFVTLLAPIMIGILGGQQFLPHGAIALQLVIWSIPIGWMNSVTNYMLISLNQEKMLTRAFFVGVAFNLVANLIFLPRYSYVAASIITIFSELVLLVLFAYFLRIGMPDIKWPSLLKKPLMLAIIMLAATAVGYQISFLAAIIFGLLVYPIGLWVLRVFGETERIILVSLLPEQILARLPLDKPQGVE